MTGTVQLTVLVLKLKVWFEDAGHTDRHGWTVAPFQPGHSDLIFAVRNMSEHGKWLITWFDLFFGSSYCY